jgi:hypothetical protein
MVFVALAPNVCSCLVLAVKCSGTFSVQCSSTYLNILLLRSKHNSSTKTGVLCNVKQCASFSLFYDVIGS